MDWSVRKPDLDFGAKSLRVPYSVETAVRRDDTAVVLLASDTQGPIEDSDFDLESDAQNVVGFNSDGTLQWMIPDAPANGGGEPDERYYEDLYEIDETVYLKHTNGRLYLLDVETGTLVNSWTHDHLPVNDRVIELDGEIQKIIETDRRIFVRCRTGDADLLGFDETGTELWRSDERRGMIHHVDDDLYECVKHGPRRETWYRLDQDTGDRIEEVDEPL